MLIFSIGPVLGISLEGEVVPEGDVDAVLRHVLELPVNGAAGTLGLEKATLLIFLANKSFFFFRTYDAKK